MEAFQRSAGLLLHPTSLPGRGGIGSLGEAAFRWVDFLEAAGQRLWQVMPLGPTGYGDSPYQCFSAFAGNPLLIDLEALVAEGLLEAEALAEIPAFSEDRVDYGAVIPFKLGILHEAYAHFERAASDEQRRAFAAFCEAEKGWVDDYALFMALKEAHGGRAWNEWAAPLRRRDAGALQAAAREHARSIERHKFWQWCFFEQWLSLKRYANARAIRIIGDIPIFIAFDSADAWANPELYHFDEDGNPTVVAGVPPDYFSATGQRWGNPLYRWEVMAERGFDWWIARFRAALILYDLVRIDHFRAFEAYWEIPAGEPTAASGRWVEGPRQAFFDVLEDALGELPIIAEDLGLITPEVEVLRDANDLPGMKVLQFAFGEDASHPYLPHNYPRNCVVYTGTHDNDTTRGWFESTSERERDFVRRYLARGDERVALELVRLACASVADLCIVPVQDVLDLGSEARMNTPGSAHGNWSWRLRAAQLEPWVAPWLSELATLYGRLVPEAKEGSDET